MSDLVPGPTSWTEAANVSDEYKEVLMREPMGHKLYVDERGTIRWEPNKAREFEIMKHFNAKDLNDLFGRCHAKKNDPIVRELYKCMGVSLYMFWEVFYWEANNPRQVEYQGRMSDERYSWLILESA